MDLEDECRPFLLCVTRQRERLPVSGGPSLPWKGTPRGLAHGGACAAQGQAGSWQGRGGGSGVPGPPPPRRPGWGAHPPAVPPRVPVPGLPYLAGSAGPGRGRRRGGGRPREDARPGGSAAAGGRVGTWGEELGWGPGLGTWAGRPVHSPRKAGAARSVSPFGEEGGIEVPSPCRRSVPPLGHVPCLSARPRAGT